MRTDDLVAMLATGAGSAPRAAVARRLAPVMVAFALACAVASVAARGLVTPAMWLGPALWTKLVYATALAAGCAWLVGRLARPAAPVRAPAAAVLAVVAVMAAVGLAALLATPPSGRSAYLFGLTAAWCPWIILGMSLPGLAGIFCALRGLAPTRLAPTGAVAGLLAGAIAAAGYALSCGEVSIAFIAVWYSLGIVLAGFAGGALGGRFLRW